MNKSLMRVDIAAYTLTAVAIAAVIAAPMGLRFSVSCNPFSIADPLCTGIVWGVLGLGCLLLYLAFHMARAWWSDRDSSLLGRLAWLIFAVVLLPYAVILYYWVTYRRRLPSSRLAS
ncbi:MAG: hypothetical protein H6509_05100 [Bryobacterales bacterium]|nr:hypothetical protein [Bryobacterales bacterium]